MNHIKINGKTLSFESLYIKTKSLDDWVKVLNFLHNNNIYFALVNSESNRNLIMRYSNEENWKVCPTIVIKQEGKVQKIYRIYRIIRESLDVVMSSRELFDYFDNRKYINKCLDEIMDL